MDKYKMFSVLEGLIFMVGDEGVSIENLVKIIERPQVDILDCLNDIRDSYLDIKHGIELVNYGGLYKFVSKVEIHEYGKRLFTITKQ